MSEKVYPYLYAIVKRKDNECSYGQPFVAYPHQLEGLLRNSLKVSKIVSFLMIILLRSSLHISTIVSVLLESFLLRILLSIIFFL